VSTDFEGGYSSDPVKVGENIRPFLDAGAVGINIEDGNTPPELLAEKIRAIKAAAARAGVDLFVNARTDVYLRGLVPEPARVETVLARARVYADAGADGLFVPKVVDKAAIRTIASSVRLPLNVLAWPELPPAAELAALGVRRLSAGSGLAQLAMGRVMATARGFLREGRSEPFAESGTTFGEVNGLFSKA
jgi:2-methylisocitrate lyase-like PEP mutase family enzyme